MAKVLIEFDTKEKSMSVTIDGVEIPDVVEMSMYRRDYYGYRDMSDEEDDDEYRFSLTQRQKDEAEDMVKMTQIVASQNAEGEAIPELPGFVRLPAKPEKGKSKASADIAKYFGEE